MFVSFSEGYDFAMGQVDQVLAILVLFHGFGQPEQLVLIDEAHFESNFLDARNF